MCMHITPEHMQSQICPVFLELKQFSLNVKLCLKRRYLAQVLLKQSSAVPQPHRFMHRHASRSHKVGDSKEDCMC